MKKLRRIEMVKAALLVLAVLIVDILAASRSAMFSVAAPIVKTGHSLSGYILFARDSSDIVGMELQEIADRQSPEFANFLESFQEINMAAETWQAGREYEISIPLSITQQEGRGLEQVQVYFPLEVQAGERATILACDESPNPSDMRWLKYTFVAETDLQLSCEEQCFLEESSLNIGFQTFPGTNSSSIRTSFNVLERTSDAFGVEVRAFCEGTRNIADGAYALYCYSKAEDDPRYARLFSSKRLLNTARFLTK